MVWSIFSCPYKVVDLWYCHYKDDSTFKERADKAIELINQSDMSLEKIKEIFNHCDIYVEEIGSGAPIDKDKIDKNREVEACYKFPIYKMRNA